MLAVLGFGEKRRAMLWSFIFFDIIYIYTRTRKKEPTNKH